MSNNIGAFVKQAVEELNQSMPAGWELDHTIEFEVMVTTSETAEGKMDIKIFSLGGNSKGEAIQKMNFSITHKAKAEEAEASQYKALSKGMVALIKPLQEMGNQDLLTDKNNELPK